MNAKSVYRRLVIDTELRFSRTLDEGDEGVTIRRFAFLFQSLTRSAIASALKPTELISE